MMIVQPRIRILYSLQFCSDPAYIRLLEDIGVDVIELTGNHLKDYGSQPLLDTIEYVRSTLLGILWRRTESGGCP